MTTTMARPKPLRVGIRLGRPAAFNAAKQPPRPPRDKWRRRAREGGAFLVKSAASWLLGKGLDSIFFQSRVGTQASRPSN